MTSWEDVINQVVIPGEPQAITDAAAQWTQALGSTNSAKTTLDQGLTGLQAWKGDAGDMYRKRISDIAQALDTVIQSCTPIPALLGTASAHLSTAIKKIPIPGEMVPEVSQARADFAATYKMQSVYPGAIDTMLSHYINSKWNVAALTEANLPMFNSFMTGIRDWFSSNDDTATKAYDVLNTGYQVDVADHMPDPSATSIGSASLTPMPTTPPPDLGGPGGGGVPKLGAGGLPHGGGLGPMGGTDGLNPLDTNTTSPPWDAGLPGSDLPGSGLAGVGGPGGGLSGIGGPGSGLGGPGLSGAGLAGLGQGTSLPAGTVKGLGPITSPFGGAGMPGMPGMGAGMAGRGGSSAGSGRSGGLVGGPGAGGGRGGQGDEHATWLQEDEDIWGTDTGAAPPLLT
jgi:uncharacterized protein YukE